MKRTATKLKLSWVLNREEVLAIAAALYRHLDVDDAMQFNCCDCWGVHSKTELRLFRAIIAEAQQAGLDMPETFVETANKKVKFF